MGNYLDGMVDFGNTKETAPKFETEAEAREWAESLGMGKYGMCVCYIGDRFTCIAECPQSEDGYRGEFEAIIEDLLRGIGLTDYFDTEVAAVDIAADATSMMYDYLERNDIVDFIWLSDTF